MTHSRVANTWLIVGLASVFTCSTQVAGAASPEPIGFNRDVRLILSNSCFACHGSDAKNRKADLRLDTSEGAFADHDGTRAIAPGDLASSEMWRRIISTDESEVMPPPDSHKPPLSESDRATLKRWIEEGAPYQKHWAFEPITAVSPPKFEGGATGAGQNNALPQLRNPIDAFIYHRLLQEGRGFSPEADRRTLIRRVAFATTGLPPITAEVEAYLQDVSSDAYEKMVDRYMASAHFGEEMSRHWLDVARYADTHGLHLDNERQMWPYRDWVIAAFNRNQPFDQFTIEQLAGDLLPNPTTDQQIATGFNRCNVTTGEGGSIDAEYLYRYAVERTSTTSQAWMGLSAGCAVCHDHKFDPISQKEFYSLYAFFNSAADPAIDGNKLDTAPAVKIETPELKSRLAAFDAAIGPKQRQLEKRVAAIKYTDPATASPPPAATDIENIWMEDNFPSDGKARGEPGHPTIFVTAAEGKVFSGERALKRTDSGLAQDVWDQPQSPLVLPQDGHLFAYVWIDPENPPKALMLQYHKAGWEHRAIWGDAKAIPWGAADTAAKFHAGPLPAAGEWQRLEVPIEKLDLAAGDELTGFATTQFGGTVYWDKVGVSGVDNPATDPRRSFLAWWNQQTGKNLAKIPRELQYVARRGGYEKNNDPKKVKKLRYYYLQTACATTKTELLDLYNELTKLQKERTDFADAIPGSLIFNDLPKPRESFVMMRGAYDKPGEKVAAAVPAILPAITPMNPDRPTRLDLARWLVSPEHPLTARVAANRFWQQFFGVGLVKTSYDFGTQGDLPSHPELLDWLAYRFRDKGWNVKELVRLMLTSATFRQSSRVSPELLTSDPDNRLYARGPRLRLDAEQIRDNALSVSGLIDLTMGGRGVNPYQPENIWEPVGFAGSNTRFYKQDHGSALYRRSIYTFFKRTAPPPFMANFDAPNREQFCTRRDSSNTPLQSLQMLNDVQQVEAARMLAERMLQEGGATLPARIEFAYRLLLSRDPQANEVAIIERQLNLHLARYQQDLEAAKKLIAHGETKPKKDLPVADLAAYTLVANMLLNLDETLTRN